MKAPGPKKIEPKLDSTLSKGLQILEALAVAPAGRGVTELSDELGLTKSNTFRLLQTLSALGYARNNADRRYQATLKAWQVGRNVVERLNLREIAASEMQFLSRETLETIYLAVPEGLQVVYIDKIESQQPIRSWNQIGGTAPIYCVGTGKAIVAANYGAYRNALSGRLTAYTDRTITSLKRLDEDVALGRTRGYSVDNGEFRDSILSIGAPIFLPEGEVIAALGISVPEVNLRVGDVERFGGLVREAASAVSAKLRQH